MRKAKLIFDITEVNTVVTVIDSKGIEEKLDITDTKMEKALIRLIKQMNDERNLREIKAAMDINSWEQVEGQ